MIKEIWKPRLYFIFKRKKYIDVNMAGIVTFQTICASCYIKECDSDVIPV